MIINVSIGDSLIMLQDLYILYGPIGAKNFMVLLEDYGTEGLVVSLEVHSPLVQTNTK